jgi:hypothetical protein
MPARLSVLLLVLLGAAASAQEPAPASEQTPPPPPLVSAPEEDTPLDAPLDAPVRAEGPLHGYEDNARFVPRLSLEVAGGAVGGFVGGGAGFLTGALLGVATVGCGSYECLVSGFVGGLIGVLLGVPSGTYLGARLLGGRGTFSATMAGSLIGWGAAGLGFGLISGTASGPSDLASAALLSLPVLGASVAYEISHADHLPQAPRPSASRPRVVPLAGFTASGARLGLAGQF